MRPLRRRSNYGIHPNMIATWKREALAGIKHGFSGGGAGERTDHEAEIKRPQAKVGELVSDIRTIR